MMEMEIDLIIQCSIYNNGFFLSSVSDPLEKMSGVSTLDFLSFVLYSSLVTTICGR